MTGRWTVLALVCLARAAVGLHLQAVAALAPFLIADLDLSYAQVGMLIGLFMLPGVFLGLPGGLASGRIGDKATLLAGLALLVLGSGVLAMSDGFALAAIGRLVSGAGGVLLNIQIAKIVTDRFAGKEISTAIGFMLATFPLGVALAMATLGGVAVATSWQVAVLAPVGATALILVVVALSYRDRPVRVPTVPLERPPLWVITQRELGLVLVAGATFALLNVAWIVFLSFTPTLLLERGLSEAQAAGLTSWASWLTIGSAAAGYVLDRTRRVTRWLVLAALVNAAVCLSMPLFGPPLLWIALLGLATAPLVVGIVALPAEVLRPASRASGFGAFFTINYLGFALLPPVAGYLLDVTRSTAAPIWFSGALWLGIVLALLLFRWLQRRGRERRPGPAWHAC